MSDLQIEYRSVESLTEYSENSRTHSDEQVDQVAASIKEFGFTNPLLVDADGVLIAGHGRLMAAKKLCLESVPVIELGHLTEAQRRAYVIADNKLAELSGWDEDALAREIAALSNIDFDISLTGLDSTELAGLIVDEVGSGLTERDAVPPVEKLRVTQDLDVWVMDGHRLICGDSTNSEHVSMALNGEHADMVWTDPPYNVNYEGGTGLKIKNDSMSSDKFYQFLFAAFTSASENTKKGGPIYIAHADSEGVNFRTAMVDAGFLLKQCLIWVKNVFVMGRQDYQWKHEPILYGWKEGAAHTWYGERNKTTVLDDDVVVDELSYSELKDYVSQVKKHLEDTETIIRENKPKKNPDHPTMKPVVLISRMLKNSSTIGDRVLDLFGGSGSTLIAAEDCKRYASLVELDPVYCDVIVRRWQAYTGKSAILENDGRTFDEIAEVREAA